MKKIKILLVGIGPVGQKIARFIVKRQSLEITGAVDIDPEIAGLDIGKLCDADIPPLTISGTVDEAIVITHPDVTILTTVSEIKEAEQQIIDLLEYRIPIVSTCEELSFPWESNPEISKRIDQIAWKNKTAVVGTGVNPGFLMDSFPIHLTAVCQHVDSIRITRIQNPVNRRIPFLKKIGAGLNIEDFEIKKQSGTLRHVGLQESVQMIAGRMGWEIDQYNETLDPVIAESNIINERIRIQAGNARGVSQVAKGFYQGKEKIRLVFIAAVNEPDPNDTIEIFGEPNIKSSVPGGIDGDLATAAITINTIPQILKIKPGLHTMADLPVVSYFE